MPKHIPKHTSKITYEEATNLFLELLPGTLSGSISSADHLPLIVGQLQLHQGNSQIGAVFCDLIAAKHKPWLTMSEFLRVFRAPLEEPEAPSVYQKRFEPPEAIQGKRQRDIARVALYAQSEQYAEYQSKLKRYQEKQRIRKDYLPDGEGRNLEYANYCLDTVRSGDNGVLKEFFFETKPFVIPDIARYRHTFVTGSTGSGKSETLKHLIKYDLEQNQDAAVVVLDPHGKLAEEVAKFRANESQNRLIYIRPNWQDDLRITINPFEISDISASALENQSKTITAALAQIIGSGFTPNMEAILVAMVSTLLHRPKSDFADLVRFADDSRNADLIDYGSNNLPYEVHREFFLHAFQDKHLEPSKAALRSRFQTLLNSGPTLFDFTCGTSTVDLEQAIEDRKTIIVDLRSVPPEIRTSIGQFITALIQGYSERRAETQQTDDPTPRIYLCADECQYFISSATEKILGESRKYGLHLILATQRAEQIQPRNILNAVISNVGVQLVGRNKGSTLALMSKEMGAEAGVISTLDTGKFLVSIMGQPPVTVQVPYTGNNYEMDQSAWRKIQNQQLEKYYVPKSPDNLASVDAEPDVGPGPNHSQKMVPTKKKVAKSARSSAPITELADVIKARQSRDISDGGE
ncbi:MAG: DUF87 domain-containing protein [Pseudomonadota bacterium]